MRSWLARLKRTLQVSAAGLALAWWAVRAVRLVVAERVPIARLESVTIDSTVLMFTIAAWACSSASSRR